MTACCSAPGSAASLSPRALYWGALAAFSVARWVGRRFVRRLVPETLLSRVDDFSSCQTASSSSSSCASSRVHVQRRVELCRGSSCLPLSHFLAATAIGDLPGIAVVLVRRTGRAGKPPRYWRWLAVGGGVLLVSFLGYPTAIASPTATRRWAAWDARAGRRPSAKWSSAPRAKCLPRQTPCHEPRQPAGAFPKTPARLLRRRCP